VPRRDVARRSPRLSGITVPRDLFERLRARAEATGVSMSRIVAEALRAWLA